MASSLMNVAAVLHRSCDLRVKKYPVPEPGPYEVLVEIRSVGVYDSDVHYYEYGRIGDFVVHAPLVLGHESSGVVVGLGTQATTHRVGQRVALEPGVPAAPAGSAAPAGTTSARSAVQALTLETGAQTLHANILLTYGDGVVDLS